MFSIFGVESKNFSIQGTEFIKNISNADFENSLIKIATLMDHIIPNHITSCENPIDGKMFKPARSEAWTSSQVFLKMNDQGEPERLMGSVRDITHEKFLEKEILQSQKLEDMGILLGNVVHEFKNKLTVIYGYVSLALDNLESGNVSVVKTSLQQIKRNTLRTSDIINYVSRLSEKNPTEMKVINPFMSILEFLRIFYLIGKKVEIFSFINENLGLITLSSNLKLSLID